MSDDNESRSFSGLGGLAAAATALLLSVMPGSAPAAEPAPAAVLAAGDAVPPFTLADQNDKPVAVDAQVTLLMLTREMDGGGLVKEALAEAGPDVLSKAHAVYVSDVSRMPSFVRGAFAMPALRKRPYPVALDMDGKATAPWPAEDGKVTLLRVASGRIVSVSFASSSAEVRAALGL